MSVTVDARSLGAGVGGTQTYVAGLVLALAQAGSLGVRAVVAPDAQEPIITAFIDAGVEVISYEEAVSGVARSDVVHRPHQIFTPADLRLAWLLGERLVISQMDLISYRNPSYHASLDQWRAYRRCTRLALASADRVVFFSEHGRRAAIAESLVPDDRAEVVGIGVTAPRLEAPRKRPSGLSDDRSLLLVLGSDYTHKNRPFAIRLAGELRRRHGFSGSLVLAGAHVEHGSSREAEQTLLSEHPDLSGHVVDLGRVSDAEKLWLLENADAHICASDYEGFGLAPLEAAAVGRPCIFAACTSLGEIVDPAAATIVPWDPAASADAAADLLRFGPSRDRHLSLLSAALSRFRWDKVAGSLRDVYLQAIASPYRSATPRTWEELKREELMVHLEAHAMRLDARAAIADRASYGLALVDGRDALLTRAEQRGLMRVAARPWLRAPLLAPFGLLGIDWRRNEVRDD